MPIRTKRERERVHTRDVCGKGKSECKSVMGACVSSWRKKASTNQRRAVLQAEVTLVPEAALYQGTVLQTDIFKNSTQTKLRQVV